MKALRAKGTLLSVAILAMLADGGRTKEKQSHARPFVKATSQASSDWKLWNVGSALSVVVPQDASVIERDAATQLQLYLQRITGRAIPLLSTQAARGNSIFVGTLAREASLQNIASSMPDDGYVIEARPTKKQLILAGKSEAAVQYAVADFLHRFGGVRWYLPSDIFEVVPSRSAINVSATRLVEKPAFSPRTFGYIWHGEKLGYVGEKVPGFEVDRWTIRQRLSVDGRGRPQFTANHNLMNIVPPAKYGETHPEYYPLINGKRQVPAAHSEVGWQPELTHPDVVRLAIQSGRDFFKANPESWKWFSLSVTDGGGWSQSAETRAAIGAPYDFRGRPMVSDMYYAFVDKVARVLATEFPERHIGVIAYLDVEAPPRNLARLPKNVNILITQESAQYHDAKYRADDEALFKRWMQIANGNVYRHDYHSLGWMVPRFYPQLVGNDARRSQSLGLKGFYTEDVPMWPMNGPLLHILARSWWNPREDASATLDEFCKTLFASAAPPLRDYFRTLEEVWKKPRPARFFEGLGDPQTQTALYSAAERVKLDALMARATKLAQNENATVKKRVAFFADGWKLASFYLRENELGKTLQKPLQEASQAEGRIEAALQILQLVDDHNAFYEEFLKADPAQSGTHKNFSHDTGWRDSMRSLAASSLLDALEMVARTDAERARVLATSLRRMKSGSALTQQTLTGIAEWFSAPVPENKITGISVEEPKNTDTWQIGPPPLWESWSATDTQMKHRTGMMRFENGKTALYAIKNIAAQEGALLRFSARYRSSEKYQGKVVLRVRWRDAAGRWHPNGGEAYDLISSAPPSTNERVAQIVGRVPEGAATAVLLIGAENQQDGDWVEFSHLYFGLRE